LREGIKRLFLAVGGKVPGYVIADKRNRDPPSPASQKVKNPQRDFLLFRFFMFSILFTPFAKLL